MNRPKVGAFYRDQHGTYRVFRVLSKNKEGYRIKYLHKNMQVLWEMQCIDRDLTPGTEYYCELVIPTFVGWKECP